MRADAPGRLSRDRRAALLTLTKGFNWVAVAWTALGFGIYLLVPQEWIKVLVTTLIVIAGYTLTMRVAARHSRVAAEAARPAADDVFDLEELDRRLLAGQAS